MQCFEYSSTFRDFLQIWKLSWENICTFSTDLFFFFSFSKDCLFMYMRTCWTSSQKRASDSIRNGCEPPYAGWELNSKFRTSGRAACALHHWATSPGSSTDLLREVSRVCVCLWLLPEIFNEAVLTGCPALHMRQLWRDETANIVFLAR